MCGSVYSYHSHTREGFPREGSPLEICVRAALLLITPLAPVVLRTPEQVVANPIGSDTGIPPSIPGFLSNHKSLEVVCRRFNAESNR